MPVLFCLLGLVPIPHATQLSVSHALMGQPVNPTSLNRYLYVLDNPANGIDPSGNEGFLDGVVDLGKELVGNVGTRVYVAGKLIANGGDVDQTASELISDTHDNQALAATLEYASERGNQAALNTMMGLVVEGGAAALPPVTAGIAIGEAVVGRDVMTGQPLSGNERWLRVGLAVAGVAADGAVGLAGEMGAARSGANLTKAEREASALVKEGRSAEQELKAVGQEGKLGQESRGFSEGGGGCVLKPNSFSSETPVATSEGEKPIGEIKVGDKVLAYDEATGETGPQTVQVVHINDDPAEVFLTIDGEKIETTPEHPWYTEDKGWVNAGDLRIGEHIRKADGSYGEVQTLEIVHKQKLMYNLTVEKAHTFFVGKQQWLVHNIPRQCLSDVDRPAIDPSLVPQPGVRETAINRAWRQEQELVRATGQGSQDWLQGELDELRRTGKVSGYTGHHINNVDQFPDWAGDPRNIIFLGNGKAGITNDHLYSALGHNGNWRNSTTGLLIDRISTLTKRRNPVVIP